MLRTPHRPIPAAAAAAVLAAPVSALLALLALPASAATGSALEGACTDADGVTVVVDTTALGGGIEAGCAPEGGVTGTEALLAAGFTESRDPSAGYICAVDGLPDPCPTEFTGEYWTYWFAEPGADAWTMYQVGSDEAVTVPGAVEGWRWGDGAAGPEVTLPVVAADPAEQGAAEDPAEDAGQEATSDDGGTTADDAATPADDDGDGPAVPLLVGLGLLALLAVAAVVVARRRSAQAAEDAEDAEDAADHSPDRAGTPSS